LGNSKLSATQRLAPDDQDSGYLPGISVGVDSKQH